MFVWLQMVSVGEGAGVEKRKRTEREFKGTRQEGVNKGRGCTLIKGRYGSVQIEVMSDTGDIEWDTLVIITRHDHFN